MRNKILKPTILGLLIVSLCFYTSIDVDAGSNQTLVYVEFKAKGDCDVFSACDLSFSTTLNGNYLCSGAKKQDNNNPIWSVRCYGIRPGDWLVISLTEHNVTRTRYWMGCRIRVDNSPTTYTCYNRSKGRLSATTSK